MTVAAKEFFEKNGTGPARMVSWDIACEMAERFAEAERRATITACLDVVRDEIATLNRLSNQNACEIAACSRIATRLKQLEEQK